MSRYAITDPDESVALAQTFVLRVTSNAFASEYVVEGDYLILSHCEAKPGDLVLATVDDAQRLGTLIRDERGQFWIESREPLVPPVCFVPGVDDIDGLVVAVVRKTRRAA
jgi:SOS-response transcriptional repressor LexA